jgi:hypothetical protein
MITRYDLKFMNKNQLQNVKNEMIEELESTEKWLENKSNTNIDSIAVQERMVKGIKEDLLIVNELLEKF